MGSESSKVLDKIPGNPNVFNPFSEGSLSERIIQGYYGPIASFERSVGMENRSIILVQEINASQLKWKKKLAETADKKSLKNKHIKELRSGWEVTKSQPLKEEAWTSEAIGFTAAYFEDFIKRTKGRDINLWDNQLYFIALNALTSGKYSFGDLSTIHRAIQLDTGEGKTISNGLVAAIKLLQNKEVIIVEQNYLSAENHAQEMAPFFAEFLDETTGLVIDSTFNSKQVKDLRVDERGLIVQTTQSAANLRRSYIFADEKGQQVEQTGTSGRKRGWKQKIVYCDHNSLGTDVASDRQLTSDEGQQLVPDLTKRVGLVQEADSLAIDEAINPFQIQIPIIGDKAWAKINSMFYSQDEIDFLLGKTPKVGGKKSIEQIRQELNFTIDFYYGLWSGLFQLLKFPNPALSEYLKKGSFAISHSKELKYDDTFIRDIIKQISPHISPLFNNNVKATRQFLRNNNFIIQKALEVLLTAGPDVGFIPADKPVLMNQYGIPLDNRQKDTFQQIFLQLYNIWQKKDLTRQPYSIDKVWSTRLRTYQEMQIPGKIANRVIPASLYKEFSELRLSSGSLIPVSQSLKDVYGAETIAVSRHQELQQAVSHPERLHTVCLDGGLAEVGFVDDQNLFPTILEQIKALAENGHAGLIVLPDIKLAENLKKYIEDPPLNVPPEMIPLLKKLAGYSKDYRLKVVTGRDELKSRGTLNEAISPLKPGEIIITTEIAHRDIDVKLGLTTIVYNPSNERALWQGLQRSLRADTPGRRILLISHDSLNDVKNALLFEPNPLPPLSSIFKSVNEMHQQRSKDLDHLFKLALSGNRQAQTSLFSEYLTFLRKKEGQLSDTIMYSLVKELPLKGLREKALHFLQKTNENLFENYLDLITFYVLRRGYPANFIPSVEAEQILDLPDKESRIRLLEDKKVYGEMGYLTVRKIVKKMALLSLWSNLLNELDNQYIQYHTQLMTGDMKYHSYSALEGAWKGQVDEFLEQHFDFREYLEKQLEELEI